MFQLLSLHVHMTLLTMHSEVWDLRLQLQQKALSRSFFLLRRPFKPRIVQWSLSGIQQLVYSLKAGEFRSVFQIKICHRPRLEVNTVLNVNMVSKDALVLLLIFLPTATTHLFFSLCRSLWIKEKFYHLHSYEILNYLALFLLFVFLYYCKKSKFSLLY